MDTRKSSKRSLLGDAENDQPMKRVNSKEQLLLLSYLETATPASPLMEKSRKSLYDFKLRSLEHAIFDEDRLQEAIEVGNKYHCSEGLLFLRDLRAYETETKLYKSKRAFDGLKATYIKENSLNEICLPDQLRTRLLAVKKPSAALVAEVKKSVINDIRFNDRLRAVLMA